MSDREERCGTCFAWDATVGFTGRRNAYGYCRRRSPVYHPTASEQPWPRTKYNDWCLNWVVDPSTRNGE